jgi:DNA-binding CsgD family transcriptional regulator
MSRSRQINHDAVLRLRRDGRTYREISELLGCSEAHANVICRAALPSHADSLRRKVLKLRAEGRLITEVAALAGCSPRHVLRILRCNKQGGGR